MRVSVVIPVFNGSSTLTESIDSLQHQTFEDWEAVIVDDGSTDGSLEIARDLASGEPRLQVIAAPHGGVCAARNRGISAARYDWVMFLDADDRIVPDHLDVLTRALVSGPGVDVVYCGTAYKTPQGKTVHTNFIPLVEHPFEVLGRRCIHDIHACLARKSIIEEVGAFDLSLKTNEDWDLWARLARRGARYHGVSDCLAETWIRPRSASSDPWQMFFDMQIVLGRTHAPDSRVATSVHRYRDGLPASGLAGARLLAACWSAGMLIGQDGDPCEVFSHLLGDRDPNLDPQGVSHVLLLAMMRAAFKEPDLWPEAWSRLGDRAQSFLDVLGAHIDSPSFPSRTRAHLERLVLSCTPFRKPVAVGGFFGCLQPVDRPVDPIPAPAGCSRAICRLSLQEAELGVVEVPVFDGTVDPRLLTDQIAALHSWSILESFFRKTLYPGLQIRRQGRAISIWRGDICLGEGHAAPKRVIRKVLHERLGWHVFLQEIWGRPAWPHQRFYDRKYDEGSPDWVEAKGDRVKIEVGFEIPDLKLMNREIEVVLAVGGEDIGVVRVESPRRRTRAQELRALLTLASSFELCRAAVRRGLIGSSLDDPTPLRERLAAAARSTSGGGDGRQDTSSTRGKSSSAVLYRRHPSSFGLGASRRAVLPAASAADLQRAAAVTGDFFEAVVSPSSQLVYAPDRIGHMTATVRQPASMSRATSRNGIFSKFDLAGRIARRWRKGPTEHDVSTEALPILMYHRVAASGTRSRSDYTVSACEFEKQLDCLSTAGYKSVTLSDLAGALEQRKPPRGRRVLLTFDDGYADFYSVAWPILKRFGFGAVVFLVTDLVGQTNTWDRHDGVGEAAELMSWDEVRRLAAQGVEFGSHTATHPHLSGLPAPEVIRELVRSRVRLQQELGSPVDALAYPFGDSDPVIRQWAGGSGFQMGFSVTPGTCWLVEDPLNLPRIGVRAGDELDDFRARLPALPLPFDRGVLD